MEDGINGDSGLPELGLTKRSKRGMLNKTIQGGALHW